MAKRYSQPQSGPFKIDAANPLAKGLVFVFEPGAAGQFNLLTGVAGEALGTGVTAGVGKFGKQLNFSGSQPNRSCSFGLLNGMGGATQATYDILVYFNAANPGCHFFGQWDGYNNRFLLQGNGSGGLIWVAAQDSSANRRRWDASGLFTASGWYRITASWQGGSTASLFVNGVDKSAALSAVNAVATSIATTGPADYVQLGTVNGGTALAGSIVYARAWSRWLSKDECISLQNNPWQIFDSPSSIPFSTFASSGSVALAGNAAVIASATGALSVAVPMAGAAIGVVTANGSISTAMPLSGVAAAVASASGNILLGVSLSGSAIAQAIATGALGVSDPLAGSAQALAAATGAMSIQFTLSGNAMAQASASGNLAIGGSGALAGNASVQASASGALSMSIPLSGSAQVVASASGNLSSGKQLAGSAVVVTAANGNMTVIINLSGAAVAQAIASGGMAIQVPLAGNAVAQAASSGYLSSSTSAPVLPGNYSGRVLVATAGGRNIVSSPGTRVISIAATRRIVGAAQTRTIRG
jgi:hypothetical protein